MARLCEYKIVEDEDGGILDCLGRGSSGHRPAPPPGEHGIRIAARPSRGSRELGHQPRSL